MAVSLKLYFDTATTLGYCRAVADGLARRPRRPDGARVGVLPSFLAIPAAAPVLAAAGAFTGAQDLCQDDRGAFTGEVSGADLRAAGCTVVEVGHAERRSLYRETDALVAAKAQAAFRNGLIPLLCVGEPARTGAGNAVEHCMAQTLDAIGGSTDSELWLAYEPVWAIGAPAPAPVEYVREVCAELRRRLAPRVRRLSILYGGSAGPGLLGTLHPAVDGLFLGRFAHDPDAFLAVVDEAEALAGGGVVPARVSP